MIKVLIDGSHIGEADRICLTETNNYDKQGNVYFINKSKSISIVITDLKDYAGIHFNVNLIKYIAFEYEDKFIIVNNAYVKSYNYTYKIYSDITLFIESYTILPKADIKCKYCILQSSYHRQIIDKLSKQYDKAFILKLLGMVSKTDILSMQEITETIKCHFPTFYNDIEGLLVLL